MEEFGVKKNELGFVWVEGAVLFFFFFFDPCSLSSHNMVIRPPN